MKAKNSTMIDGVVINCESSRPFFVRYKNGAMLYSMSVYQFTELAREAKAIYKIGGMVLVNCREFEHFLEYYRLDS